MRAQAAADLRLILQDPAAFAWPVTLTSPAGLSATLLGSMKDVPERIDPDTGVIVVGREVSVTLPIAALAEVGMGVPVAIPEKHRRPWVVQLQDHAGALHSYKVSEAKANLGRGVVVCMLEAYTPTASP